MMPCPALSHIQPISPPKITMSPEGASTGQKDGFSTQEAPCRKQFVSDEYLETTLINRNGTERGLSLPSTGGPFKPSKDQL